MQNRQKLLCILLTLALVMVFMPATGDLVQAAEGNLVSSVEVTQVMGKGIDLESGGYYFMNTFVAEKPTCIQVVLTEETTIDSASVDIYYEGQMLTTVYSSGSGSRQLLVFTPSKDSVNAWQAGRYKFVANVNGHSKTTEAIFNESRSFSILLISASVKHNGIVYDAPDLQADSIVLRTQALPISENKLKAKYRNAKLSFGTEGEGYDISNSSGSMSLLSDIDNYRTKSAMGYDVVVAVVNAPLGDANSSGGGTTAGYTDSNHAAVVTLHGDRSKESLETTLLHEIGHLFGNGDEYVGGSFAINVNGAPYGVSGRENGKAVQGERHYLLHATGNDFSGILIDEVQNPYNPKAGMPMLGCSSFMGSSYKHWPTSMVWEEAYKHLVPNNQNVLPRVYTDGTIVAARPSNDEFTDAEREALITEFFTMLDEVRVEKGYEPYKQDNIWESGQKHLHVLAQEILRQRNMGKLVLLDQTLNAVRADINSFIGSFASEASLDEYNGVDHWRSFFTLSPCGNGWISHDYMLIDFVKCEGVTYFIYTTIGNISPNSEEDEVFVPQPEEIPVPEINPVTDEAIDPDEFAGWVDDAVKGGASPNNDANDDDNDANDDDNDYDEPDDQKPAPADPAEYAKLTKEQQRQILRYDAWDVGNPWVEHSREYIYGFLAWYTNDQYGRNLTADNVQTAINSVSEAADYDGVGEHPYAEYSRFQLIAEYYELYPPQELREADIYLYMKYPIFGQNPQRAKNDTDSLDAYFATRDVYPEYSALTEQQRLEVLGFGLTGYNDFWLSGYDDPYDYIYGYYALYVADQYGLNVTKDELLLLKDDAYVYNYFFEEVCIKYKLYPPQALRQAYPDVFNRQYDRFGEEPKRAKSDSDSLDYYYETSTNNPGTNNSGTNNSGTNNSGTNNSGTNDPDINDPDGDW